MTAVDPHANWQEAISLGVRLGLLSAEAARRAMERMAGAKAEEVTPSLVASWLGCPSGDLDRLLRLAAAPEQEPTLRVTPGSESHTIAIPQREGPRLNIPRTIGPYELLDELGHGGMGIVFRARHVKLGSECAVKVLIAGEHASPEAIARFQREAAAVAKMGRHPNIVTVFDLGEEGSLTYYAMDLVQGQSLHQRVAERPYAPKEAAALVEKVARALHFAHGHGVIHRDVKPENIVVRADGEPQVLDFGLAREIGSSARISVTGQVMGTPAYMAPEQVRGEVASTDARTDVYALGAVLYELLTGIPPYGGRDLGVIFAQVLAGDIVPPRRLRPDAPRDLETVCLKCLELLPSKRYVSAEALADDLARFQRGEPVQARPVGAAGRFVRRVRRHPLVSGLIGAIAASIVALAWRSFAPAWVEVAVSPPNARVLVNGKPLPASGRVWPAGEAYVTVEAEGHQRQSRTVPLPPGTRVRLDPFALDLDHGFLSVDSEPGGAQLLIDDAPAAATTPAQGLAIPNGSHKLTLRLRDHADYATVIAIRAGETLPLGRVSLVHQSGTLSLTGNPAGIGVTVREDRTEGAEMMHLSPPAKVALDTGSYVLDGRMPDHFERQRRVVMETGQRVNANLSLERQLLWKCRLEGLVFGTPALGDLDGDGALDSVIGDSSGMVYAFSGTDGGLLWKCRVGTEMHAPPVLADLDGDGALDVVVGSSDKSVYALSGRDGSLLWRIALGGVPESSCAAGDLDGDGTSDVLIAGADRTVTALSGRDGKAIWSRELDSVIHASPVLADLGQDGHLEVLVSTMEKGLYALSASDGSVLWMSENGGSCSAAALGDLDGDGTLDIVLGSSSGRVYALSGKDHSVLWTRATGGGVWSSPALADLDGDGDPDVVVGSKDHSVYALSGRNGGVLWSYQTGSDVVSSPALGDLAGDGTLDVVIGSNDNHVYALSGKDGSLLWRYKTGAWIWSSPRIADLQGDGVLDVVVGSMDGNVYALRGAAAPMLWTYETNGGIWATPAAGDLMGDGGVDVVIGSQDGVVHALSGRNGDEIWTCATGGGVGDSAVLLDIDGDGALDVLVGANDGKVYALSGKDGSVLWTHPTSAPIYASPGLLALERSRVPGLLVAGWDGSVSLRSPVNGAAIWSFKAPSFVGSTPAIADLDADGVPDAVFGCNDGKVYALSGTDGSLLWSHLTGGPVYSGPAIAPVRGEGAPCVVVGSDDGKVYALSGRDGSLLWSYGTGNMVRGIRVAVGDLLRKGGLDVVVGSWDGSVYALSGRDGSLLWKLATGGAVDAAPAVGRVAGEHPSDVVVTSGDGKTYALSGQDGAILWTLDTGGATGAQPVFVDLDHDGVDDVLLSIGWGKVCAIGGRPRCPLAGAVRSHERSPIELTRYGRLRHDGNWRRLADLATERIGRGEDPWVRAVAYLHLGIAQERLGSPKEALDAFAEARKLHLRAPDGAVFEWLASWRWEECPADRRGDAERALLDALSFEPDVVFDAFAEARGLFTPTTVRELPPLLDRVASDADAQVARVVLLAAFVRSSCSADLCVAAERRVLAKIQAAQGSSARWHGYLALLAVAERDRPRFDRACAAYFELPHRPPALDMLLSEDAAKK